MDTPIPNGYDRPMPTAEECFNASGSENALNFYHHCARISDHVGYDPYNHNGSSVLADGAKWVNRLLGDMDTFLGKVRGWVADAQS